MDTALEVVRLIMEYFGLERDALIGVSLWLFSWNSIARLSYELVF